jgi:Fe-S oxidoreductase
MTLQDHCAGCGGTFFLKDFETSQKIFERKRRSIEGTRARTVVTGCPSCMIQLETGAGDMVRIKHIAQVIDEAL